MLLEQPRGVDVDSIERELGELWKRSTEDGEDGGGSPVVRACMLNLLVVTESSSRLQTIEDLVGDVTQDHPARIFLILADGGAGQPALEAMIAVRCSLPVPGGRQVCCEQISLTALGKEAGKIPSVVASLLVPDVPTVLLWKAGLSARDPLFLSLNGLVDKVLIDSSDEPDPILLLRRWTALTPPRHDVEFGDLAWSHLTPWRSAIAQAFNPLDLRPALHTVEGLKLVCSTSDQPVHSGLSQGLMMIAWLASRLQWQIVTPVHAEGAERYAAVASAEGRRIELSLDRGPAERPGPGGIEEISIRLHGGTAVTFASSESRSCIRWSSTGGRGDVRGVLWAHDRDESSVLARELEVLMHDDVYDAARSVCARLLGPGHDLR